MKEGVHLVNWEILSIPQLVGGLGLKNIFQFSKSLAVKSLWGGLVIKGIWNDIIQSRHRNGSFLDWIRNTRTKMKWVSNVWRNMLCSWYVLGEWLAWSSMDG